MMPVHQRCPQCGNWFWGSDAIGRPCMTCDVLKGQFSVTVPTTQTVTMTETEALYSRIAELERENAQLRAELSLCEAAKDGALACAAEIETQRDEAREAARFLFRLRVNGGLPIGYCVDNWPWLENSNE